MHELAGRVQHLQAMAVRNKGDDVISKQVLSPTATSRLRDQSLSFLAAIQSLHLPCALQGCNSNGRTKRLHSSVIFWCLGASHLV